MRNASSGTELPSIWYIDPIPQPLVIELGEGWKAWDAAVAELDAQTPEGRAHELANRPAK